MAIEKLNIAARSPGKREQPDLDETVEVVYLCSSPDGNPWSTVMTSSSQGSSTVLERQRVTQGYPQARVIVLDDDVNTFQHVVDCLRKIIPGMSEDKAWSLANTIDSAGSAEVWCGPLEQAELYHQQLAAEGLTMAPRGELSQQAAVFPVVGARRRRSTVFRRWVLSSIT